MYTVLLQLPEDREGLCDKPLIRLVFRFEGVQQEDHAGVEGLLADGPADEHARVAVVEKEEGFDDADAAVDDESAAADGNIRSGVVVCVVLTMSVIGVARWRVGLSLAVILRALNALAVEEDNIGLYLGVQRCRLSVGASAKFRYDYHSLADIISSGHSGRLTVCLNQLSLNCRAAGIVSHNPTSLSVNSSIFPTFIMPSLLKICRDRIVK